MSSAHPNQLQTNNFIAVGPTITRFCSLFIISVKIAPGPPEKRRRSKETKTRSSGRNGWRVEWIGGEVC